MTNQQMFSYEKIAKRAEDMGILDFSQFTLIMDLELADKEFNLRLEDFIQADDLNFSHDVCGIQKNINRETKEFNPFFIPRFSKNNF